jgi:hypothetical protein
VSIYELLREVAEKLELLGIPYIVTGSLASMEYSQPRSTLDIDIVIQLQTDEADAFVAQFAGDRFYIDTDAVREAILARGMFNVIDTQTTFKIDFVLPKHIYDRRALERGVRRTTLNGIEARFATPEDVIISKLVFYKEGGSDKHLTDIGGILDLSGDRIDTAYVAEWADAMDVTALWQRIRNQPPTDQERA